MPLSTGPSRVTRRPGGDVGGRGRAERPQVAADDLLDVRLGQRAAQPAVDVLVDDPAAALPRAARRDLDERGHRPGELPELGGGVVGEALGQRQRRSPSAAAVRRPGARTAPTEGVAVHVAGAADALADPDLPLVDGRGPLPQHQRVVGGEQVDGAAHHQEPDQRAVLEAARDGVRVEVLEPRGQGQVRRQVLLRLEPDQVAGPSRAASRWSRSSRCWRCRSVRFSRRRLSFTPRGY